jgi:hypothetical protein
MRHYGIGYQITPMRNSNILHPPRLTKQNGAYLPEEQYDQNIPDQDGEGLRDLIGKAGKFLNKVNNSKIGTLAKNVGNEVLSSSKYKRSGFPGELHPIVNDWDGKKVIANYLGPGTNYKARSARGDQPVSALDSHAKIHDGAYERNRGNPQGIRNADVSFINNVRRDSRLSSGEKALGIGAIGGKVLAEKMGKDVMPKDFSGQGFTGEREIVDGLAEGVLPGMKLKKKMLRQQKKQKQKKYSVKDQQGDGLITGLIASIVVPALIKKIRNR